MQLSVLVVLIAFVLCGLALASDENPHHLFADQESATPDVPAVEEEADDETRRIKRSDEDMGQRTLASYGRRRGGGGGYGGGGGGRGGYGYGYGGRNSNGRSNDGVVLLPIYGYGGR